MSKGIFETIAGGVAIAGGIALAATGVGAAIAPFLIHAGEGLLLSGIGTLISGQQVKGGFGTTIRQPIEPWQVVIGNDCVGGTLIYVTTFGDNDRFLDLHIVLAAHLSLSVDQVLFDKQLVQIGNKVTATNSGSGNTSFTPLNGGKTDYNIVNTADITRTANAQGISVVVTVTLRNGYPPLLQDGDFVVIQGVEPTSTLLNGRFQVQVLQQGDSALGTPQIFTYLAGGPPTSGSGSIPVTESGQVQTQWPNYASNVYIESINDVGAGPGEAPFNRLGFPTTLGTTFMGQTYGTPLQGDFANGNIQNGGNGPNPWTPDCSLVGFTSVMLRLQYDPTIFSGGIPQVSFIMRGKADISDPRTSPPTVGYTTNPALVIGDYLNNSIWGFNAEWGSEIDIPQLIAAANICDEQVPIALPLTSPYTTENRYEANGHFKLSQNRGDILQNLLSSCGGRITYTGGLFQVWPAAWYGSSPTSFSSAWMLANSAGPISWRSSVTINNRYNGVRGTYISPVNNWQPSDFPYYAQDATHGYNNGPPQYDYDQNLANDQGQRRWKDIQLPFTKSCDTAQRLAKIELLRSLYMGTGTFPLNMAGYQLATLDIIQMSFAYFGWTNKYLEVAAVRFKIEKSQKNVVLIGTEIDVQETDPSIYDWELIEDLTPQGYGAVGVPDAVLVPDPPTNLSVAGGVLTWTAPQDAYVTTIGGRYQLVASPPGLWISLGQVPVSVTQMELPGLEDGETYIIELQSITGAGVPSQWVSIITVGEPEFQWAPFQIQAPSNDALFPGEWTFDLSQVYQPTSGTDWTAVATFTGAQPVNAFIPNSTAPVISQGNVFVSTTGGSIPGGSIVYLAIGALDAGNNSTPGSIILSIPIPSGTNTNKLTIGDAFATSTGTFSGNPPVVTTVDGQDGLVMIVAGKQYVLQGTLTNVDGHVALGATLLATIQNLYNAVNLGPGAGTAYAAAMTANGNCTATAISSVSITFTAAVAGASGNSLTASGIASWSSPLSGSGNFGSFAGGMSIAWPLISGLANYVVFASLNEQDLICEQETGALTAVGSPATGYTPTTGIVLGSIKRSTWGYPYASTQKIRIKGAFLIHGGVEGAEVDAVSNAGGTFTILASECADLASPPTDNWAGRVIAIIGRNNSAAPYCSFDVTAFNPFTGLFTLAQDPVAAGVEIGDALVVCTLGVDNSSNPLVITDPGLSNAQDEPTPHTGLLPHDPALLGTTVMVIKGKSRGMTAHIVDNLATSLTLDGPILIDATSVWIIYGSNWLYQNDSVPIDNFIFNSPASTPLVVSNAVGGSIIAACFTVDSSGDESFLADAPLRMLFVWGAGMAKVLVGSIGSPPATQYQMLPTDQLVEVDASGGPFTVILPDVNVVRNSPRFITKVDTSSNVVTILGFNSQTVGYLMTYSLKTQGDTAQLLPTGSI